MEANFKIIMLLISISLAINGFFIARSYSSMDMLAKTVNQHSIQLAVIETGLFMPKLIVDRHVPKRIEM